MKIQTRLAAVILQVMDRVFPLSAQERVFGYLYNRVRGQGMGNPASNGECDLLDQISYQFPSVNMVAFDVGGNKGDWSKYFLQAMGGRAFIHIFEPSKKTFDQLSRNLEQEIQGSKVKVIHAALGQQAGKAPLHIVQEGDGSNSLYNRKGIGWEKVAQEEIVVEAGDQYCQRNGVDHIDMMKIDVEGHEIFVLKGFEGMLRAGRIDRIQFEYGGAWIDSKTYLRDVFDLVAPLGYSIGKIHPLGVRFFDGYRQSEENFVYANYLIVKNHLRGTCRAL